MSESFSITRVDVLEKAKSYRVFGLCYAIRKSLIYYGIFITGSYGDFGDLPKIFPKFTREYAMPFGANEEKAYWWRFNDWEGGRMDFLNWLIDEYKDDTEDLGKIEL